MGTYTSRPSQRSNISRAGARACMATWDPHRRLAGGQKHKPLPYHEGGCDNEACAAHMQHSDPKGAAINMRSSPTLATSFCTMAGGTELLRTQVDPLRHELPDVHV